MDVALLASVNGALARLYGQQVVRCDAESMQYRLAKRKLLRSQRAVELVDGNPYGRDVEHVFSSLCRLVPSPDVLGGVGGEATIWLRRPYLRPFRSSTPTRG